MKEEDNVGNTIYLLCQIGEVKWLFQHRGVCRAITTALLVDQGEKIPGGVIAFGVTVQ